MERTGDGGTKVKNMRGAGLFTVKKVGLKRQIHFLNC